MLSEKEIGTVISLNDMPNTYQYLFVIDKNSSEEIKKGIYVYTKNEQGYVLGFLEDITRANKYLENPEAVSDYGNKVLAQHFPLDKWDYLLANVSILGVLKPEENSFLQERAALPPVPGNAVFKATDEMLSHFFGVDENGLELGKVFGHSLSLKVNLTRMFQKHLAILAMSGAGKSNLTKVILEELLERKKRKIASIVFDIHGEYVGLSKLSKNVHVVDSKNIKIPASALEPHILKDLFPDISQAQYGAYVRIKSQFSPQDVIGIDEIITAVRNNEELKANVKQPLLRYLEELRSYDIIGTYEKPDLSTLLKPGNVVLINLVDVSNTKKLQIIAFYLLKRLFNLRRKSVREGKKIIPPTAVFIEEAHNLAPQMFDKTMSMAKVQIEKIAREGRKFNLSLCLITQRPSHLSQTALSQCNTQIILRITNPNDHKFIADTSEHIDSRTLRSISSLSVGEGILLGEAVNAPVFVKFKKSRAGETSISKTIEEEAEEYEKEDEEDITDAYL